MSLVVLRVEGGDGTSLFHHTCSLLKKGRHRVTPQSLYSGTPRCSVVVIRRAKVTLPQLSLRLQSGMGRRRHTQSRGEDDLLQPSLLPHYLLVCVGGPETRVELHSCRRLIFFFYLNLGLRV